MIAIIDNGQYCSNHQIRFAWFPDSMTAMEIKALIDDAPWKQGEWGDDAEEKVLGVVNKVEWWEGELCLPWELQCLVESGCSVEGREWLARIPSVLVRDTIDEQRCRHNGWGERVLPDTMPLRVRDMGTQWKEKYDWLCDVEVQFNTTGTLYDPSIPPTK